MRNGRNGDGFADHTGTMGAIAAHLSDLVRESVFETLWPTRCALCDVPGDLICEQCLQALARIDQAKACPRCGSPFGIIQCCDCSSTLLEPLERQEPPFDGCRSALLMDEKSGHIVSVYKDAGEQRLSLPIARIMLGACDGNRLGSIDAITYIPCSKAAFRRRGFDHAELIARDVARLSGAPVLACFERPTSCDQRRLTRRERFQNMQASLAALPGIAAPETVLVVDDAYTTGATMFAAADALRDLGCARICGLTFARA